MDTPDPLPPPVDRDDPARLATIEGSLDYWRARHEGRPGWAAAYWQSQHLPERRYLMRAIGRLAPFESLMEFGCNAGPNLSLIRRAYPAVRLVGIDINREALRVCRESFAREGLGDVELLERSLYALDDLPAESADLVLTSGVLIHIPPDGLRRVLEAAWRIARRAVVMQELHAFVSEQVEALHRPGKWCRDFWQALDGLAPPEQMVIESLPPNVGLDYNARDGRWYCSVNATITVLKRA